MGRRHPPLADVRRPRDMGTGDDSPGVRLHYGLARSKGAVLRYLSDALTALRSRVPAAARTDEVTDLVEWLGELVHEVDTVCSTSGSS